jgi:peroxin-5
MPVVPLQEVQQSQQMGEQGPIDQDELARTAGLLVDSVQNEQNPKFQNSQFLGLMKQLRDRTVVVEGNQMVERPAATTSSWAGDFQADVKGKGRAVEPLIAGSNQMSMSAPRGLASDPTQINRDQEDSAMQEDPNDAYFRQENEEYTRYWNEVRTKTPPPEDVFVEPSAWDQLQQEWEAFEATSVGIKPVNNYQFQSNNPYVLGDSSTRTRNHLLHTGGHQSFFENVLELEATVQRDPSNATAWFQLGVKQQEAEREQKAIQALLYAADLDPTHLPTWLALAVSYTNDGKRNDTYNAIRKWVDLNSRYAGAVQEYLTQSPENPSATITDRFSHLIQCLISMARSNTSSEVDADIQIALAVLLNTNEDYEKAQDCFRTALAVRPEDWLLYNRVGATMANSGHAEEALQYYYRALELNPAYIRARFNLGISCINLRVGLCKYFQPEGSLRVIFN